MAATGFTPIQLYRTSTPSSTPTAGNLADGELAINTADGKLFYKDSGGVVQTIANKNNTGTVTSVGMTVPSFLSVSGSPVTSSGTLAVTYSGTALPAANGGTGVANNAANTITFSGNFGLTLTLTNTTSVTLPTSGTVATKGNAIAFSIVFGL